MGQATSLKVSLLVENVSTLTFSQWMEFFTGEESADITADADSDGWLDFIEFAGVANPVKSNVRPFFQVKRDGDFLEIGYDRWPGGEEMGRGSYHVSSLCYELEVLEGDEWQPFQEALGLQSTVLSEARTSERAVYRSTDAVEREVLVLRLKVTLR